MIADAERYCAMKESGVSWLGEVPEHWEVMPAFAAYRPRQVKNTGMRETVVLSLSYGRIVVKPPEKLRGLVPESFETYQVVEPGNIIVRTTDLQNDQSSLRIGHAQDRGIITSAYMCLEATARVLPAFGYQYLNAYDLLKIIYGFGSGLRQNLDFSDIKRMPVLVPPLSEQAAIVRFLDHADRSIRRYIRAKQKLIKLLEEQKQAIIHRAVTRGVEPNVRLKPSGVEWLGDVPGHWEVVRLARVIADGPRNGISPPIDERGTIESFSISAIRDGQVDVRDGDKKYISGDKTAWERTYRLLRGDVLLVRGNGNVRLVGKAGLVEDDMPGRVYPDLLMRVRLARRCLPQFLVALLNCPTGRDQIETAARTAVGTFKINNQQVRQLCFALPPAAEQRRIVDWLSEQISAVKAASYHAEEEISLLREYRTRLIADVVTGKLDVRETAARLPDESEEPELLGEAEDNSAAEAPADDVDLVADEAEV
jgi:type I restriction enzyme S subunit